MPTTAALEEGTAPARAAAGGGSGHHLSTQGMTAVQRVFYRIGRYAARRPWHVGLVCAFVSVLCGLGLLRVVVETSPQQIWVPPDSTTSREKAYFDRHFTPFFRIQQLFFLPQEPRADVLGRRSCLQAVLAVQKRLERGVVEHDGRNVTLDNLCFKPIQGKGCLITSPGQYWLMSHPTLAKDPSLPLTAACHTQDELLGSRSPCLDQIGTPVMRQVVFGGLGVNAQIKSPDPCGGTVPTAAALVVTLLLKNYDPSTAEGRAGLERAKAWEKGVFLKEAEAAQARLANDVQAPMRVRYLSERSVEDSLSVETSENAWVVLVSYLCMLVYVSLALGRCPDLVRSRFLLGVLGILIVVASLAIALGTLSLLGLHTTLIVWEVVPFLILAIGVDNMFIISREFDGLRRRHASSSSPNDIEDLMGHTLAHVGPSILAAATSECLAFAVGALTNIPALQQFCLVAALAVLADFVLQITWFVAGLALDARRVDQGRYDGCPCFVRQSPGAAAAAAATAATAAAATAAAAEEEETGNGGDGEKGEEEEEEEEEERGRRKWRDETSLVSRVIDQYYIPALFSPLGKACVLLLSLFFLACGLYGLTALQLGLEPQLAAPTDHYLIDYYNTQFSLGEAGPPAYLVIKDVDYADKGVRDGIRRVSTRLAQLGAFVQPPVYSWMDAVESYIGNENLPGDCPKPDPALGFYNNTRLFLSIPIETQCCQASGICGEQYQSDVIFASDAPDAPVVASRLRMQLQPLRDERAFINSYFYLHKYTRELASAVPERYPGQRREGGTSDLIFPYSLYFVYYEQYTYIQGVALTNVLVALAAVFLCTALLTGGNWPTAAIVVASVLGVVLGVVGILALWNLRGGYGIRINAVSVVNLVMAVGLAVEFVVHIATSFLTARDPLPRPRSSASAASVQGGDGDKPGGGGRWWWWWVQRSDPGKEARAKLALSSMGASIFSGITLTKLVGIAILAIAPSHLFRVYYFRLYLALILLGAFFGLAVLPVFLSFWGPASAAASPGGATIHTHREDDGGNGGGKGTARRSTGAAVRRRRRQGRQGQGQGASGNAPVPNGKGD